MLAPIGAAGPCPAALQRRREDALARGLADLAKESLELERLEADEGLAAVGARDERVGDALGAEGEAAGRQGQLGVADVERELAVEDVEPLVLLGMDVPGGAFARRAPRSRPGRTGRRVRPADLDRLEHAEQPERLAVVGAEPISELARSCSTAVIVSLLPRCWYVCNSL